jgi:hypothetical protein
MIAWRERHAWWLWSLGQFREGPDPLLHAVAAPNRLRSAKIGETRFLPDRGGERASPFGPSRVLFLYGCITFNGQTDPCPTDCVLFV